MNSHPGKFVLKVWTAGDTQILDDRGVEKSTSDAWSLPHEDVATGGDWAAINHG